MIKKKYLEEEMPAFSILIVHAQDSISEQRRRPLSARINSIQSVFMFLIQKHTRVQKQFLDVKVFIFWSDFMLRCNTRVFCYTDPGLELQDGKTFAH